MLVVADIGNTNMKLAFFKGKRKLGSWRLKTEKAQSVVKYEKKIKKILLNKPKFKDEVEDIIICSVVPKLTPVISKALSRIFKKDIRVIGKDIILPIKNLYKKPHQVGQDRLVNAFAAGSLIGVPAIIWGNKILSSTLMRGNKLFS